MASNYSRRVRSFGRVKSRKLSNQQLNLLENILLKYDFSSVQNQALMTKFTIFKLEIGSGSGDFIINKAQIHPDICFIACEPHMNSVANILQKSEELKLNNLFIFKGDAREVLEKNKFKFAAVYILNPDPWPKACHHKRRLININFLDLLHQNMAKNSKLTVVTDHDGYKEWIMEVFYQKKDLFFWLAKTKKAWLEFPKNWVFTKYQKKAVEEGRKNIFLEFVKC